jgi:hypothetical protein
VKSPVFQACEGGLARWGGNALVVFPVSIGSDQTLSAHYYTPSSGWGNAQSLDTEATREPPA